MECLTGEFGLTVIINMQTKHHYAENMRKMHSESSLHHLSSDQCGVDDDVAVYGDSFQGLPILKIHMIDGCLKHYTNFSSLESILRGGQLRLKKYDKMFGDPSEGEYVFSLYEAAIKSLDAEGALEGDIIALLFDSLAEMRENKCIFRHYMFDINEVALCTPYCICFTPFDFNSFNGNGWLAKKDLCIHFSEHDLAFNKSGVISKSSHGAIEFFRCQYTDDSLQNCIRKYIQDVFKHVSDAKTAITRIEHSISRLRMCVTPICNSLERETRLVFFLPNDLDNHPKIKALLSCRRGRDNDNNFIDLVDEDDSIYLNIEPVNNQITITVNGKSDISLEQCKELIKKYGYESCVYDSEWPVRENDEDESILGKDNLSYDACIKKIDELVTDTIDPTFSIIKATIALKSALKYSNTYEQYDVCSKKAIELLNICLRMGQSYFVTLLRNTLPLRKKWSKEYCDCVYQASLDCLVVDLIAGYNDGLADILLRKGKDILSKIIEDILTQYGEAIFEEYRTRYCIDNSDGKECVEYLHEVDKKFFDFVNAIIKSKNKRIWNYADVREM